LGALREGPEKERNGVQHVLLDSTFCAPNTDFARHDRRKPMGAQHGDGYAVLWFIFDRASFNWHGVATLATWCMTLVIQRGEHRDTQAIHAKLDELRRNRVRVIG
jgi:hypothetical protein